MPVSLPNCMTLVCPTECRETTAANETIQGIVSGDNPIDQVLFLDLRQSMNNGGGPACLRLRVFLDEAEQAAVHSGVLFNSELAENLSTWIERHYRDELRPDDLRDPKLIPEVLDAMQELSGILNIPAEVLTS